MTKEKDKPMSKVLPKTESVLKLAPKLAEDTVKVPPELAKFIKDRVEIQLITQDILIALNNCEDLVRFLVENWEMKLIMLHLPFPLHYVEIYAASEQDRRDLYTFTEKLHKWSEDFGVKFGIIIHEEYNTELIERCGIEVVDELFNSVDVDKVQFYVENCLPSFSGHGSVIRCDAFELVRKLKTDKVAICIDVCHARCWENLLKTDFEIPEDVLGKVEWIHFAATLNGDGYLDKSTHGKLHPALMGVGSVAEDLMFLRDLGINLFKVPICTEIGESDYVNRPDQIKELQMIEDWAYISGMHKDV